MRSMWSQLQQENLWPWYIVKDPAQAVYHAGVLEEVAKMAILTCRINPNAMPAPSRILDKHYFRKHGDNAYYGQGFGSIKALDPSAASNSSEEDIQIAPSNHTVELKNISEIGEVARPVINKPPKKEEDVFKFDDKAVPSGDSDMSSGMDIMPLEPDAPGEDLLPLEPDPVGIAPSKPPFGSVPARTGMSAAPAAPVTPAAPPPAPKKPVPPAEPLDFTF